MQELYANALAEDASVFDYDGVYDQMKAKQQPVRALIALSLLLLCAQHSSLLNNAPGGTFSARKPSRTSRTEVYRPTSERRQGAGARARGGL